MADYYCDHGAYGTGAGVLGATPTWGVPQEGDGSATTASTTASTASVLLNGQPTSGQVLSVCGVSLTAGTTFAIGASPDITANNIAAAINASTGQVNANVSPGQPRLQNLVYARGPSGGAPSATVELMMRVGSASLNAHASNQITSTFGTAPTITQWNGGVGGCFGYFVNDAALGVGSFYAIGGYGVFPSSFAYAPAMTVNDTVYVRTATNKTISFTSATITRGSNARLIFDTNTKWTVDSANGTLTLSWNMSSSTRFNAITATTVPYTKMIALRRGGFKISATNTQASGALTIQVAENNTSCHFENVAFEDASTLSSAAINLFGFQASPLSLGSVKYLNCDYTKTLSAATIPTLLTLMPNTSMMRIRMDGCTFTYNISGTSDPGPLFAFSNGSTSALNCVTFSNCKFVANGYSGGLTAFPTGQPTWVNTTSTLYEFRFENVSGLRYPTAFAGLLTTTYSYDQDNHLLYMNLGSNGFRYENCRGMCDWNPLDNPPYYSAKLPDGTTSWSLRALWYAGTASGVPTLSLNTPFSVPEFKIFNRLSTGSRTIVMEFLAPNTLTFNDNMVMATVSYTDSTGASRVETFSAVSSSTAEWTSTPVGYSAKKISISPSQSILTNTEISVKIDLIAPPSSGSNSYLYFNPDPNVS